MGNKIYQASQTILLLLIILVLTELIFDETASEYTAIVILISMMLLNANELSNYLSKITKMIGGN